MRKPYFRNYTKTWYINLDGRQINLGRDKDAAFQKYHELMANRGEAQSKFSLVAPLFDEYLSGRFQ